MNRLALCLTLALAVAVCATAAAADRPSQPLDTPLTADLDGDGAAETVRARELTCFDLDAADGDGELPPPCPRRGGVLRTLKIEVADTCVGGEHVLALSREMDGVSLGRIVDADGDGQARELAFEARAGATGRGVQAKVVSFEPGPGVCVAVRKTLFSYPQPATIGRRPRGASFASGDLAIKDFDKSRKGLELRTTESYARRFDAGCCPTYRRVTYWRFVAASDRYSAYRTKLTRRRAR